MVEFIQGYKAKGLAKLYDTKEKAEQVERIEGKKNKLIQEFVTLPLRPTREELAEWLVENSDRVIKILSSDRKNAAETNATAESIKKTS